MTGLVCAKCSSSDFLVMNALCPKATTIIFFEGKELSRENFGESEVLINVCRKCREAIINNNDKKG